MNDLATPIIGLKTSVLVTNAKREFLKMPSVGMPKLFLVDMWEENAVTAACNVQGNTMLSFCQTHYTVIVQLSNYGESLTKECPETDQTTCAITKRVVDCLKTLFNAWFAKHQVEQLSK